MRASSATDDAVRAAAERCVAAEKANHLELAEALALVRVRFGDR